MATRNKWLALVVKLPEITQNNNIRWAVREPLEELYVFDESINKIYTENFRKKNFRIYKEFYKFWPDDEGFEWSEGKKLEFINNQGRSEFVVPSVEGIGDLFAAAKFQTADIERSLQGLAG